MGSVYKRKRHSCKMCKPHKIGWMPKLSSKQRDLQRTHQTLIRDHVQR
jgi:hypothetical protein